MIDLNNYDLDTIRLILKALADKYGNYEMTQKRVYFTDANPEQSEADEIALSLVKNDAILQVNARAEEERIRHIGNSGIGMLMIYQKRFEEAKACIEDPEPTNTKYPFLAVEIGYYGNSLEAVANTVIAASEDWARKALILEQSRRAVQEQIKNSSSIEQVKTIVERTNFRVE